LSELLEWFKKRREERLLQLVEQHLETVVRVVENLENTIKAATRHNEKEMATWAKRVVNGEKEADKMRREVMDKLSRGALPSGDREDLMNLVKQVDMIADWSRESIRVLNAFSVNRIPDSLNKACLEMVKGSKECAFAVRKCFIRMINKPEEALQVADQVERQEEKVDFLHEKARRLLVRETEMKAGLAVLVNELFEAIEMIADYCEGACDQVRIIIVRQGQTK
jgi:hypothetical protein